MPVRLYLRDTNSILTHLYCTREGCYHQEYRQNWDIEYRNRGTPNDPSRNQQEEPVYVSSKLEECAGYEGVINGSNTNLAEATSLLIEDSLEATQFFVEDSAEAEPLFY